MVARAVGGSLVILTLELMKGPPLLLVGCWSSSRWVVSGWWGLRREKSIISSLNLQIIAQHPGGQKAWSLWVNPACDLCLLVSELCASPYSTSSLQPHLTSPCLQTVCYLSFLMPQRPGAWLAFSSSFFHSFATHCISTGHLWQKPKKSNTKLQCASYSLVPSPLMKKRKDATILGTCQNIQQISATAASDDNTLFWSVGVLSNKWSQTDAKAYLQREHKAISLYLTFNMKNRGIKTWAFQHKQWPVISLAF